MFDWNDLRYFLAVAREGSTIAAADALKVNQSTVQRRLAALEDELERKLVERFPTGYCLTATGLALRPHAEAVEAAIAAFERELSAADRELSGTIRVTGAEGLVYLILTPLVEAFRSAHPGVAVEVITTERKLDLARGEADVAFRTGVLESSDLVGRKVADLAWAVYATRGYVERHGRPAHPREIEKPCGDPLRGGAQRDPRRPLAAIGSRAGARVAARSGGVPGMLLMVRSGVGLAALPAHIGDSEAEPGTRDDPVPELMSPIHLLAHADLHKTARVRAFFDFVIRETSARCARCCSARPPATEGGGERRAIRQPSRLSTPDKRHREGQRHAGADRDADIRLELGADQPVTLAAARQQGREHAAGHDENHDAGNQQKHRSSPIVHIASPVQLSRQPQPDLRERIEHDHRDDDDDHDTASRRGRCR